MKQTNTKERMFRSAHLLLLVPVLFFALSGCDQGGQEDQKPELPAPDQGKAIVSVEYPAVCWKELSCIVKDFKVHFRPKGAPDSIRIDTVPIMLDWTDLEDLIGMPINPNAVGVKFHYGATMKGGLPFLQYAVELVGLIQRKDTMFYEVSSTATEVHPIKDDGTMDSMSKAAWESGPMKTYFEEVELMRTNDKFWDALFKGADHQAYVFKWKDLDSLHVNNEGMDRLLLFAIATPKVRKDDLEDDWGHEIAIAAAKDNVVMVNDDPRGPSKPYKNKAADLGVACPPHCSLARFYRYGLAPRFDCKCN